MSTTPKTDKLNIRERKFIKGLAAGLTPTEAMRQAGYAEMTAVKKSGAKVAESRIQESIQKLMEKQGITDSKLMRVLDEGLSADRDDDRPDHPVRHKFLDTALKIKSHYPSDKVEHSGAIEIKSIEVKIID